MRSLCASLLLAASVHAAVSWPVGDPAQHGFNPAKRFVRYVENEYVEIPSFSHKTSYSSYGGFLNAKIGYKYAYFVPALSIYHQNYGTYDLFGIQQESYRGLTIIPSLGLQLNLGYERRNKKRSQG